MTDAHSEFRAFLPALRLGLLPEEKEAELRAHGSSCAECATLLASSGKWAGKVGSGPAHLPVVVLGLWLERPDDFPTQAADTVCAHLAECESCRHDLAELGGGAGDVGRRATSQPERKTASAETRWRDRLAGAAAGALAIAAAWLLVSSLGITARPQVPTRAHESAGQLETASKLAQPLRSAAGGALPVPDKPVLLKDLERSPAAETTVVEPHASSIVTLLPPLLTLPRGSVEVRLLDGQGIAIASRDEDGQEVVSRGVPVNMTNLPWGTYVLQLRWGAAGRFKRDYPFVLRHTGRE